MAFPHPQNQRQSQSWFENLGSGSKAPVENHGEEILKAQKASKAAMAATQLLA
jgi:hypothetical protein